MLSPKFSALKPGVVLREHLSQLGKLWVAFESQSIE